MIHSHREQPIEEGKDCDVVKSVSEIIFEAAFQNLAQRHDVSCPAQTMPTGVSLLAYRQTSPGNMTQFSTAVIQGINIMMSL